MKAKRIGRRSGLLKVNFPSALCPSNKGWHTNTAKYILRQTFFKFILYVHPGGWVGGLKCWRGQNANTYPNGPSGNHSVLAALVARLKNSTLLHSTFFSSRSQLLCTKRRIMCRLKCRVDWRLRPQDWSTNWFQIRDISLCNARSQPFCLKKPWAALRIFKLINFSLVFICLAYSQKGWSPFIKLSSLLLLLLYGYGRTGTTLPAA